MHVLQHELPLKAVLESDSYNDEAGSERLT